MKRVGILTFHRAENIGAVLQAYALCKTLESLGAEPEIIDYRASAIEDEYRLVRFAGKSLWEKFKTLGRTAVRYRANKRRKARYADFIETVLPLSRVVTKGDLAALRKEYDIFISGSDQVLNPELTKEDAGAYLLSFVDDMSRRYSYAASFGRAYVRTEDAALLRRELSRFNGISVREKSGALLVMQLTGRAAQIHLDPTLLCEQNIWSKLCSSPTIMEPYLLLYIMLDVPAAYECASKLSERTGFRVICINGSIKMHLKYTAFRFLDDATPKEFLPLISHAQMVITNSFHGTAFSILFQKPFLSVLPAENDRNDRILSLLSLLGLTDRAIFGAEYAGRMDAPIDWDSVETKLALARETSSDYLFHAIRD